MNPELLYQDKTEIDKIPYAGDERREGGNSRSPLSSDNQELLNAIRGMVSCKDKCVIPKEAQPSIPRVFSTLAEIGSGSYYAGVERLRDNYKESSEFFLWIRSTKALIWKVIVMAIAAAAIGLFGRALWKG